MIPFESFEELLSILAVRSAETWYKFRGESGEAAQEALRAWFMQEDIPQETALASMDALVDEHSSLEDMREYLADLVMLRIFNESEENEEDPDEYFESDEWIAIEEQFMDRGTEALNFLIYLRECLEFEEKPSLEDFINEYLLEEDEDGDQEEFFIYEEYIKYQSVVDGPIAQIFETANVIERPEIQDIFLPVFLFFRNFDKKDDKIYDLIRDNSANAPLDAALLRLFISFWQSVH